MKASVLLDMIGNTDERIIEEAGKAKKPAAVRWLRRLSVAACLCLAVAGGILFFTRPGANPGSLYGAGSTGHAGGSVFMSYAGPVFPLTLREENPAISAARRITLDFAPWVPVWISNEEEAASREGLTEEERQEVLDAHNRWFPKGGRYESSTNIRVTDSYTLTNADTREQTVRILYPFASSLNDLHKTRPTLTLNGEALDTVLHSGTYAGSFQGTWDFGAEAHDNPGSVNLDSFVRWEDYRDLLADGTYLQRALGDFIDFRQIPVILYAFTDARGPERNRAEGVPNPTIRVMFDLDYDRTRILTWGFNGGLTDEEQGIGGRLFGIPEAGTPGYGVPKYLIVMGEDVENLRFQGYATGGWDTKDTVEAGVTVTRRESDLEEALQLAAEAWYRVRPDEGDYLSASPEDGFALAFGLMKEHLAAYGVLSENGADRYAFGMIEDLFEVTAVTRVFWLEAEITVPAGGDAALEAAFEKKPSLDFGGAAEHKGVCGYDLVTELGSDLAFTGQTARLEDRGQIEILRQNFGFDPAGGVTEVTLDPTEPHYYLEVKKAERPEEGN